MWNGISILLPYENRYSLIQSHMVSVKEHLTGMMKEHCVQGTNLHFEFQLFIN